MSNPFGPELKRSKYRILGLVGQGQFGRVYCAVHRQTGRLVALKNLEHQRFPTHKFLRELRFLLSLQHPNIVTCKALEHTSTGRYLVMDYCEGGTLRGLIESEVRLNLTQGIKLVADLLAGLAHAHDRGIVHCDIKPENILLSVQPRGWVARISDFGIAKLSQEMGVQETGNTGSPAYMAPERFYGQYFQSSDLYSVGIILFELLAGHRPFSGTPVELMSAHLNRPVQFPDTIDERWHLVLRTALQKLPARRFKSAQAMLAALEQASQGHLDGPTDDSADVILLAPTQPPSPCEFVTQHQQRLNQPMVQMAMLDNGLPTSAHLRGLYLGEVTGIRLYAGPADRWLASEDVDWASGHHLDLGERVLDLVVRPQGCFALTETAIHHLMGPDRATGSLAAAAIATYPASGLTSLEPGGRWWATISGGQNRLALHIHALQSAIAPVAVPPTAVELSIHPAYPYPHRLLIPDGRHLLVLFHATPPASPHGDGSSLSPPISGGAETGTLVQIYTRRGDRLGHFTIPIQVEQVVFTPTPYRLLATEAGHLRSILVIDLKPYRVTRLAVNICPQRVVATDWGYLVADAAGRIGVLDDLGQWIGEIAGPPHPTAIALFQNRGLMVATWEQDQGMLYIADLGRLNLDLMF